MTTPNIEELILKLRGQAYTTCRPDQLCDQAADLLQSQAERIKELEEEIGGWREDQKENIGVAFALQREVNKITSERDELREKYTDTYWALDDAARENTSLRVQLAAIAAAEPVGAIYTIAGVQHCTITKTLEDTDLFTHPMPAQDVTELVDALKDVAQTLAWMQHGKCRGFSDGLLTTDEALDKARPALAKYKGAKQ